MENKISHLSAQQIESLMAKYYAGEKTAQLIEDYKIDCRPGALVSFFPPIVHTELLCPYCVEVNLQTKRKGRSANSWNIPIPTCPSCGHNEKGNCLCINCKTVRKDMADEVSNTKRIVLRKNFNGTPKPKAFDLLSLKEAVYLMSLVKYSASEDFYSVAPFQITTPNLAPTFELQNNIVKLLLAESLIAIDPESDLGAFNFDASTSTYESYYPTKASWVLLPHMDLQEKSTYLRELQIRINNEDEWPEDWNSQIRFIWREITKYECFEYYEYLIRQRNFDVPEFGEKTHSTFEHALNYFSPAQVFNIAWQAVRDTTDYIVREGMPKYKAKNMFIGAVNRKIDKYRAENWEARQSHRDFNCPQTVLSSTFFDSFMRIGTLGFTQKVDLLNHAAA